MAKIKISPEMFIHPPYKKCPKCGQEKFGILTVLEQSCLFRCSNCFYPQGHEPAESIELPKLSKKVVYLDQFAISEMTKAKSNPSQRKEWFELYNLIDGLVLDQVIICPDSKYHEEESELFVSLHKNFKDFYENLSRGITFTSPHHMESRQTYRALKKFVGEDETETYNFSDWNEAFKNNPNSWQDKIHFRVNLGKDPNEIKQRRIRKEKHLEITKKHFEQLPCRDTFDFSSEVRVWQNATANSILTLYYNYIKEYIEMGVGVKPFDPMWYLNAPLVVDIAEQILYFFQKRGIPNKPEQISKMREFLYSDCFRNTPHVLISSLFHAGISRKFVYGARKEPGSGDCYDIAILSHLAPYCHAMFVDNETRAIMTEGPINLEKRFDVRLFSMSTKNDFINYLRNLEDQTTAEIRNAVVEVYGELHAPS